MNFTQLFLAKQCEAQTGSLHLLECLHITAGIAADRAKKYTSYQHSRGRDCDFALFYKHPGHGGGPQAVVLRSTATQMMNNMKKENNPCFHMPCHNAVYSARTAKCADLIRRERLMPAGPLSLLLVTWHTLHRARKLFQPTLPKMFFKFGTCYDP